MSKSKETKQNILKLGWDMASHVGLESVTIGNLAKEAKMSKSGLFAHFESKENLQIEILSYAAQDFSANVIIPALQTERGIPRIKAIIDNWMKWCSKLTGNCIFVSSATEFSDRPGKVRDFLLHQQKQWIDSLRRIAESAIKAGDFKKDINCDQFAFDLYSLLLGAHNYHKLLHDNDIKNRQEAALNRLLDQYRSTSKPKISKSSTKFKNK